MPRLLEFSLRGVRSRYLGPEITRFDLRRYDAGTIALVGVKGAGKSTALECMPASIYRRWPSRPDFYGQFAGRDALLESIWEDGGHELTYRLLIDAEHRKMEAYVFEDGKAITDGKTASFDAEVERRFGSWELFLATVFSAQERDGSFLDAKTTERKKRFLELLGLGLLDLLSKAAGEHRKDATRDLTAARAVLTALMEEVEKIPSAREGVARATVLADQAAAALEEQRAAEALATDTLARARSAGERIAALTQAEQSARAALLVATKAHTDAVAEPGKISKRAEERRKEIRDRGTDRLELGIRERHENAMAALHNREGSLAEALREVPRKEDEEGNLGGVLEQIAAAEALDTQESAARAAFGIAREAAERERERVRSALEERARELERLKTQAGLLDGVPCTKATRWHKVGLQPGAGTDLAGTCPVLADARGAAERAAALPAVDTSHTTQLELARQLLEADLQKLQDPERATRLAGWRADRDAIRGRIARAEGASLLRTQRDGIPAERRELEVQLSIDLANIAPRIVAAREDLARVEEEHADAIMEADEQIREKRDAAEAARAAHTDAQDRLAFARAETVGPEKAKADLEERTSTRQEAERTVRAADSYRATCQAALSRLEETELGLEDSTRAVRAAEQEFGDWSFLEEILGRDGVQALEVDAASPEVTSLANEILLVGDGPQFSIRFDTQRETDAGHMSEVFDVLVYEGGQVRDVKTLSGGEKVIVGESIRNALSIYNTRKSGKKTETYFRDEPAGALDPASAARYIPMVQRTRLLAGAHHVLVIAHQEEVWEAADVQIRLDAGKVAIEEERVAA